MYKEYQLRQVEKMSQSPSPSFRLCTELGYVPGRNILSKVTDSLGHGWEVIAGVRPPSHLLTTLLHCTIHNPTMWKNLPLQLHRPDTSVNGAFFPGERQRELQNIPCARSAHTIKHLPYYHLSRPSPHTANPFYFCPLFYCPLTCVAARKGTQHFCSTHRLRGPKNTQDHSAVLSRRSLCTMTVAVTQSSFPHTWQLGGFYRGFSTAVQRVSQSKAAHEAGDRS